MTLALAILGSTKGTSLQAIINAIEKKELDACIKIVVSNKANAFILERAKKHNIETFYLDPKPFSAEEYDQALSTFLKSKNIDLIVLIGYMRILSKKIVNDWKNKIINVHPSLLPEFAGGMNESVHQDVLDSGKKETGCTVHYVTEEVDAGPILLQKKCEVLHADTVDTLKERVQTLEGEALIEVIRSYLSAS